MKPATLHVVEEGRGDAVVLVHAIGCDLAMWDDLAPALAKHFRVVREFGVRCKTSLCKRFGERCLRGLGARFVLHALNCTSLAELANDQASQCVIGVCDGPTAQVPRFG